jgi:hypothetical protein
MNKPRPRRFTPETVNFMCDMMDNEGLTAAQVGEIYGISRSAVIGLRFRAGRSGDRKKVAMAKDNERPAKPCLRCGSTAPRDPAHRICEACKKSEIFSGMYGAY